MQVIFTQPNNSMYLKVPDVKAPRRHSTGTDSKPKSPGYWKEYLRLIKIKQQTIAVNKASAAVAKIESERMIKAHNERLEAKATVRRQAEQSLEAHNKRLQKRNTLREANIRLRHKMPDAFL
jgi:hypothetical protein